jgi:hypothetical protein
MAWRIIYEMALCMNIYEILLLFYETSSESSSVPQNFRCQAPASPPFLRCLVLDAVVRFSTEKKVP